MKLTNKQKRRYEIVEAEANPNNYEFRAIGWGEEIPNEEFGNIQSHISGWLPFQVVIRVLKKLPHTSASFPGFQISIK